MNRNWFLGWALLLITWVLLLGTVRRCNPPVPLPDTRRADSLGTVADDLAKEATVLKYEIDSLRDLIHRTEQARPPLKTQIDHAYHSLYVDVDSLANLMLESPTEISGPALDVEPSR